MINVKDSMLLYAITDRKWEGHMSIYSQLEEALSGGVTCVQLREKNSDYDSFLKEAIEIKKLCNKYGVPLIINDNVDIAIEINADGVHIGQSDMNSYDVREKVGKDMIIGVTAKTVEQAITAEKNGANYLGVGAINATDTKLDAKVITKDNLKEICNSVNIPIVAIGGITKDNILELEDTGVSGVALVSAIFSLKNIKEGCRELKLLSERIAK